MSETTLDLAGRFSPATLDGWRAVATRGMRDGDYERRLVTRTLDGLAVQPLYTEADLPAPGCGAPGAAPFARGAATLGSAATGWGIVQALPGGDLDAAAAAARDEVQGGATGLELHLGAAGLRVARLEDLERVTAGLDPGAVELHLDAGVAFAPAAALLAAWWSRRGGGEQAARGSFGADPLGALARRGEAPWTVADGLTTLGRLGAWTDRALPLVSAARVDTAPYHDAGASRPQELGLALAAGLEYLRALTAAGLDLAGAARQVTFAVSVDCELFAEVAKLRALRLAWARVLEVCAGAPARRGVAIHARTAARMLTGRDPWVNALRATVACAAAALGGAERITVTPFDAVARRPSPAARRLARNTQVVLQAESHLHRVIDPAGGAYAVERLTADLAQAAWAVLRQVEGEGGLAAALAAGSVQERLATSAAARARQVATRELSLVGVSAFPLLDEPSLPPGDEPAARLPLAGPAAADAASLWSVAEPGDAVRAAAAGGSLARAPSAAATCAPLPLRRLAAPFEALRDASDAWRAARGRRPQVFLACLGPRAEHAARTTWVRNLLAAGGVEGVGPEDGADGDSATLADGALAAFETSGLGEAIVCGADARYPDVLPLLAPRLAAAGAQRVIVAGAPGARRDADLAAGVAGWVHVGQDVLAFLEDLVSRLTSEEAGA